MIFRAKYVLKPDATVLENGTVRVENGGIVEVTRAKRSASNREVDFGDALLSAGLVNAHTHLELGKFANQLAPSPDFAGWLRSLVDRMLAVTDEAAFAAAVRDGLRASLEAGTTLVGDITHRPKCTRAAIVEVAPRPSVVSFGEVVAVGRLLDKALERLSAALDESYASETLRIGVSPHALYTVAPAILAECAVRARTRGASLCVHAAETRAEEEYARGRLGPIQDFLRDLQLDDDSAHAFGMTPIEHLAQLEVLGPGTLLAHGNYLSPSDIQCLSRAGTSVAYCPRTHHAFGHDRHPVRELIEAGVNVCLGTDSLASNPTLSVLEEMRFIHQHRPEVGAEQVFKMATGNGAAALGWLDETGTIEAGKRADFVVLPVELDGPDDPLINVLGGQAGPSCVVLAGEMVST